MLEVVPEAHVGEQGDREEDCGDPTANVGDEGEDCPVLTVRHTSSGQVLHTHKHILHYSADCPKLLTVSAFSVIHTHTSTRWMGEHKHTHARTHAQTHTHKHTH